MLTRQEPFTTAQRFLLEITHGMNSFKDYKAPHAYRPTPPRQRKFTREERFMVSPGDAERKEPMRVRKPRLFKGHRI